MESYLFLKPSFKNLLKSLLLVVIASFHKVTSGIDASHFTLGFPEFLIIFQRWIHGAKRKSKKYDADNSTHNRGKLTLVHCAASFSHPCLLRLLSLDEDTGAEL